MKTDDIRSMPFGTLNISCNLICAPVVCVLRLNSALAYVETSPMESQPHLTAQQVFLRFRYP